MLENFESSELKARGKSITGFCERVHPGGRLCALAANRLGWHKADLIVVHPLVCSPAFCRLRQQFKLSKKACRECGRSPLYLCGSPQCGVAI